MFSNTRCRLISGLSIVWFLSKPSETVFTYEKRYGPSDDFVGRQDMIHSYSRIMQKNDVGASITRVMHQNMNI